MTNAESQYAYLLVRSDHLTPGELTSRIGTEPSEARERGSRREGPPPVPRCHIWSYRPEVPPGVQLQAHLKAVEEFLTSHVGGLRALVDEDLATVTLEIVRTVETVAREDHLGLSIDRRLVDALTDCGASIDIDEYRD